MSRPAEVPTEQIIVAGEALLAAGKAVNGFSLRKAVGRGGPDYLNRIWTEAQMKQAEQAPEVEARPVSPLPPALADHRETLATQITAFVDGVVLSSWRTADDIAQRRTSEEREQARKAIASAEQEIADAKTAIEDADRRAGDADDAREQVIENLRKAEDQAQVLKGKLDAAQEAAQQAKATIDLLTTKLGIAETAVSAAQEASSASKATADAAKEEVQHVRRDLALARQEVLDLRKELDAAHESAKTADQAAEVRLNSERTKSGELAEKLAAATARAEAVESQVAGIADLTAKLMEATTRAVTAETTLAMQAEKKPEA